MNNNPYNHPEKTRAEQTRNLMDDVRSNPDLAACKLIKGNQFDRLEGLDPVFEFAPGRRILDLGCHRGMIGYEFARRGATVIHGFDLYAPGISAAKEIFADIPVESRFETADLALGRTAFLHQFGDMLLPRYEVVLLLSILQHLRRQMERRDVIDFLDFVLDRTAEYLVLRMPNHQRIEDHILDKGFELVYLNALQHTLSPVAVYRRRGTENAPEPSG